MIEIFIPQKIKMNALLKFLSLFVIVFSLLTTRSIAQERIYANSITKSFKVDGDGNAIDPSESTFAKVNSYGGAALGLGSYNGELELKFPTTLPAGTTSFVRVDFKADVLDALLGGNIGGLLATTLGNVVLGDHYFEVGARNGTTAIVSAQSNGAFASSKIRVVQDGKGYYYIAITPSASYDRVYIKDITKALLLGGTNFTNVYYAFYVNGTDNCGTAIATGYEGDGLSLDLLGLGKAGVTNAKNAIDTDLNNYSELSLGALGVAGSISQNFYFGSSSTADADFNLRIRISSALLKAGVLDNITVTAYDDDIAVYTSSASQLLNLDLLGLLQSGNVVTIPFTPGKSFDKVKVTLSSLLSVNLTQTVFVYGLTRSSGRPTFTSPQSNAIASCYNSTVTLGATTSTANKLLWYDSLTATTALAETNSTDTYTTPALTANKVYYVATKLIGCSEESGRVPITITVRPQIIFNTTVLSNATSSFFYSKQITAASGGSADFKYALSTGSNLPAGLSLSPAGVISGTPTASGNYTFNISAIDGKNCSIDVAFNLTVASALSLVPNTLANGITTVNYTAQNINPATGGTGPYTYSVTGLPPGLSFNNTTLQITGLPSQKGTYTVPVTVTDVNGNSVTANYTIKIVDILTLPAANLANGTIGVNYTTQIIPSAVGGTLPYSYTATGLPTGLTFNTSTREITGLPQVSGIFPVNVVVNDADAQTASNSYQLKVNVPLVLPAATLPDAAVNVSYPAIVLPSAQGGVSPYVYDIAAGLPQGMSFNSISRQISGIPTQAGIYNIQLKVTDTENNTASNYYVLNVLGALSLAPKTLPDGTVGSVYVNQTLPAVVGGTGPYTYALTGLPAGLNFNTSTREITGTPSVGGSALLTLLVTDGNNNKVSANYLLNIAVPNPVVADLTVCAGKAATLNVLNFQSGVTYNLYAATGSTPIASNTTGVFVTAPLTTETVFYVEAVSGTAVSSRVAVKVSINSAATPANVTSNNVSINTGQSAILTATADVGNTIKWFDSATGGTELATGNSFTTPVLSNTTTYYVGTVNTSGCESANRIPVTVTVLPSNGAIDCNKPNKQNSGITGICVLCGIADAGNSVDADNSNFTRVTLSVGVAAVGYQRLIFQNTANAADSVRLTLGLPSGLADVSVLSNIMVSIMNGNTVVKSYSVSPALLHLTLLGGNKFTVTVAGTAAFDRVEVKFGGLASLISSLDIYGAELVYPNPVIAATDLSICANSSATINATPSAGTTLNWYSSSTGGTLLASGNSYSTPNLTATTTYYIEVSRGTCTNSLRFPVQVKVNDAVLVPAVAASVNVCSGNTASLSVQNADATITYKWYSTTAGGTALFTGSVFVTPALSSNTSYYVEASQGSCVSATRALVQVIVSPKPMAPNVSASSTIINEGQSTILTASSTETDVTFNWYDSANSTTALYTGDVFVTPVLTASKTYYVEAKSNTSGCVSSTRVQITISVTPNGTPYPVPCEAALTQTNGVTGVALLAGAYNPDLAVDNDQSTGSSLVMPVGLLGASVYQQLNFGSVSSVGDTIKVLLSAPSKVLSLAVLGNITISSSLAGTNNGDGLALNNNLLSIQLLNGASQALITFVPTQTFDAVNINLNSGLLGALTSINVNYANRILKAADVVAKQVTVCSGQTASLSVNPKIGLTYQWFDSNGNYLTGKDGTSFTTPAITADTKYFVAAVSVNGCIGTKVQIDVKVKDLPLKPVLIAENISVCTGSNVLLAVKDPIVGVTYKWYDASNDAFLANGITYTVSNVTATSSFYVMADNGCSALSDKTTATITIGLTAEPPVLTASSLTVSANVPFVLTANSNNADATINWYDGPDAGANLLYSGNPYTVSGITATTTFYAKATTPICGTSAESAITITVGNGPNENAPCGFATVDVNNGVTGIAVLAGVYNPVYAIDGLSNTGSTLFMPVGLLNASVYHQIGFNSLSNVGDTLKVKVTFPSKLISLSLLQNISLLTYNGPASNGDLVVVDQSFLKIDLLSGGQSAILSIVPTKPFDRVELRLTSGVVGALSSVDFNYAQRVVPVPVVDQASLNVCEGGSATLSVKNPQSGITYKWYLDAVYQAGKDGTTFTTDPSKAAGSYNYYVTATANGCETIGSKVTVTVLAQPAVPVAVNGNPASTCLNSPVTLSVVNNSGVIYNWYDASTGGNILVSNNSSYVTPSGLAANTYDFYVEAVNQNACSASARTKISLIVKPTSTAADIDVSGNLVVCATNQVSLNASSTTVTTPKFTWYSDASLTQVVSTQGTFTTTVSESTKYYVTVSGDNKCANNVGSAKEVSVTVNPVALASDITVSGNNPICAGSAVSLTASSSINNAVYTWYRDADLNDKLFVGANLNITSLTANTTYYVTVQGDNKCENSKGTAKAVSVVVKPQSTANDFTVSGITTVCKGTGTVLTASSATVINPVFTWYSSLAPKTVAYVGASYNIASLTANTTLYVTVQGDNQCENSDGNAKVVTLTAKDYATSADITLSNAKICAGSSVSLMASSTTVAQPVFTWYSDASLTIPVYVGATYNLTGITQQTIFYVTVKGSDKCENVAGNSKVVTVDVNNLATTADIMVSGNATICAGGSTALVASSTGIVNPIYTWYADVALTNVAFVGANFTTPVLNSNFTYYVTVKGDNKCENNSGNAKVFTVTVNPTPVTPVVSTANTNICAGSSTTLNIQNAVAGVTYEWYNQSTGGSILYSGPSFTTPALNTSTDYYVQSVSATGCVNATGRLKVTVTVNAKPLNPAVPASSVNACVGSTVTLSVDNPVAGVVYNWYTVSTGGTVVGNGAVFITPKITANATYYVEAVTGSCTSAGRTMVSIVANQMPLAPTSVGVAPNPICNGSTATLTVNNPDANLIYRWYTNSTGGVALAEGDRFTTPSLTASTIYYVESISKTEGCTSQSRTSVNVQVLNVLAKPIVSVKSTDISSITFSWDPVSGAQGYEVSFDNGLNWAQPSSGILGTTATIAGLQPDQSVTILVRTLGQISCQTSLNSDPATGISKNPLKNDVYIPNAFSPNNDGKNDVFLVYGTTIRSVVMKIYNQWGQLILLTDSVNQGWDGTYKGVAQPTGVYVYVIDVESKDGTRSTRKGTVTLIR